MSFESERQIGVAEAKRHFSEVLDRVRQGERFVVSRHGRPAAAIVPPEAGSLEVGPTAHRGLAEFVGILEVGDQAELEAMTTEIYEDRRRSEDRGAPNLD